MAEVTILLASYNGEKYLRQMLDSIVCQDFRDWSLVLSDDGSSDDSVRILQEYADKYPDRIIHYKSGKRFGTSQGHFMHLLREFSDTPYIMFCDQDDVWHGDKISKTIGKMKEIETDTSVPVMVHADLRVVDAELNVINESFMNYSGIDGNRLALNNLLVQNVVTGCTMMINNALAKLACKAEEHEEMLMHDWWISILAAACGETGYVDEALIDYRQHGGNVVGAKNSKSIKYILNRLKGGDMKNAMRSTFRQAEMIAENYNGILPKDAWDLIYEYGRLSCRSYFGRLWAYIKYGFWKKGSMRIAGQIIWG